MYGGDPVPNCQYRCSSDFGANRQIYMQFPARFPAIRYGAVAPCKATYTYTYVVDNNDNDRTKLVTSQPAERSVEQKGVMAIIHARLATKLLGYA